MNRKKLLVRQRTSPKRRLIDVAARLGAVDVVTAPEKAPESPPEAEATPTPTEFARFFPWSGETARTYKSIEEMEGKQGGNNVSQCLFQSTGCCGVKEFRDMSSLDTPAEVLAVMVKFLGGVPNYPYMGASGASMGSAGYNPPHVLFTGITKLGERKSNHVSKFNKASGKNETVLTDKFQDEFVAYLKKHDLGPVWEGPRRENSCYGNEVGVYIWNPDYKNLKKWAASHLEAVVPETPDPSNGYNGMSAYKATTVKILTTD